MRFSIAALTGAYAVTTRGARAEKSVSRDLLRTIMDSAETSHYAAELGSPAAGPTTTSASFASAVRAQWTANEERSFRPAPYLVCDTTPDVSGSESRRLIASRCETAEENLGVVQNLATRTCFTARLHFKSADSCAHEDHLVVIPYTPWMKMSAGSFLRAFGSEDASSTDRHRFLVSFCQDALSDNDTNDIHATARKHLLRTWDDITEECPKLLSFDDVFQFRKKSNGLQLHPSSVDFVEPPVPCVLALIKSLAVDTSVCVVEYDAIITTQNIEERWIVQGSNQGFFPTSDGLPFFEEGIEGQNQVAQVSDSGLHLESCYFYDQDGEVPRDTSETVDMNRRKVVQYYAFQDKHDGTGHGTHCAGTIAGKLCTGSGCSPGASKEEGVAPEAKIAFFDCNEGGGDDMYVPSLSGMSAVGIKAGAFVHSASWASPGNEYTSAAMEWDKYVHHNQKYLAIMAAGNSGAGGIKGTVQNVGKNVISVCATLNRNNGGSNYIADFSSSGWTSDGRRKPDICAPGKDVASAGFDESNKRTCKADSRSGTSMAAPGVAGAALLLRQYFMEGWYPSGTKIPSNSFTPSGSLIRAVIMNSGKVLLGRKEDIYDDDDMTKEVIIRNSIEYDEYQGFGLISLLDAVYLMGKSKGIVEVFDKQKLDNTEAFQETFMVGTCEALHTSIMLDFFDVENTSTSCDPCLVNQLHLTVVKDNRTYYPNGLTHPDTINNSQRIRITTEPGGNLTVHVTASKRNFAPSQKFALVVSGCIGMPAPNVFNKGLIVLAILLTFILFVLYEIILSHNCFRKPIIDVAQNDDDEEVHHAQSVSLIS